MVKKAKEAEKEVTLLKLVTGDMLIAQYTKEDEYAYDPDYENTMYVTVSFTDNNEPVVMFTSFVMHLFAEQNKTYINPEHVTASFTPSAELKALYLKHLEQYKEAVVRLGDKIRLHSLDEFYSTQDDQQKALNNKLN